MDHFEQSGSGGKRPLLPHSGRLNDISFREHLPTVDTIESVHIGAMMDTSPERVQTPAILKNQRRSIAEKRRPDVLPTLCDMRTRGFKARR
jgi:hypothetical protein